MPSMKCYHCGQVKRCQMRLNREGQPEYLCPQCARELGYSGGEKRVALGRG